ncbi:MAG: hypothetical protein ACI4F1_03770 [Bariatricus sp.]
MIQTEKLNKDRNTATPYDDVYRTLLNDCTSLIIPVVNEVFRKKHGEDEEITVLSNEFYITGQDGKQKERITDSNFIIGNSCYHFECQSTADGTIIMRVFEYGSQIAIRDSYIENNVLTVHFPKTAILYLRQTKNLPDYMNICIRVPEASCTYRVPVMKVQNYSLQEIFDKNLFFLIPFHIFAYEKKFPEYESDGEKLQELMTVYQQIITRLNECTEKGIINEYIKKTVIAMSRKVLEALTVKYSKVQEGVGKIMGGKILDYEAKDILNQGREEGRMDHLAAQVQKKLERGDSVEKIADDLVEEVVVIKEIIAKLNGSSM